MLMVDRKKDGIQEKMGCSSFCVSALRHNLTTLSALLRSNIETVQQQEKYSISLVQPCKQIDVDQRKGLDRIKSREISVSWRSGCPSRGTLNPLSNFTTSQLLTQHSPLNHQTTVHREPFTRHPTDTLFLPSTLSRKENSNCVLCPPRSKTSSPSVCRRKPPTTSGPDRLSPRLDSVTRTSFAFTQAYVVVAPMSFHTLLPCVKARSSADRRHHHAWASFANSRDSNRPLRRSR